MRKRVPKGFRLIFRRYITKNGRRIYPKRAKAFPILVRTGEERR
jgi:hypothetical protein